MAHGLYKLLSIELVESVLGAVVGEGQKLQEDVVNIITSIKILI